MNKIVAVIPTTLKRETLLIRSIESVLSQTRPADHIVISCDANEPQIKTFAALFDEKFPHVNIQIVANIRNKGLSGNLNNAFDQLTSFDSLRTIVSLLDDDDFWMPDYLAHVEKRFPGGTTFVAASFKYVGENEDGPK